MSPEGIDRCRFAAGIDAKRLRQSQKCDELADVCLAKLSVGVWSAVEGCERDRWRV